MKPSNLLRLVLLLAVAAVIIAASTLFDLEQAFSSAERAFKSLGIAGPLVFALLYGCLGALAVPTGLIEIIAGAIFGMLAGTVAVLSGALIAAAAGFFCGRWLAGNWLDKRLADNKTAQQVKAAVEQKGFWIIALVRLSPAVPFNITSYVLGASRVHWLTFMAATTLGMLPIKLLLVWVGASGSDLVAAAKPSSWGTQEWVLYGGGTLATILVVLLIGFIIAHTTRQILRSADKQQSS